MKGDAMAQGFRLRDRIVPLTALIAIVVGCGLLRLVVVLVAPAEVSIFAPDEAAYTDIIGFAKSGGDWAAYQLGYGAGFWPQGRALLVPALGLMYVGLEAIHALRVVSVLYSTGSALLLVVILWIAMRRGRYPSDATGPRLISWPMLGIGVFLLLPSHALWNSLALREAATEFWVLASVALSATLFAFSLRWWQKALVSAGIAVCVAMAFQSRGYMAVALSLALAAAVVWLGRERPRFSIALATAVVAGTIVGLTLSLPATVPEPIPAAGQPPSPGMAQPPSPSVLDSLRQGVSAAPSKLNPDVYLERGSYQREVSAQYANSAIATDSCAGVPDPRSLRLCEITRLPGAAFAVMFRPLWPLDTPTQWSGLAVAASIENVAWLALAIAVIYVLAARRSQLTRVLWICLAYGGLLIAGMAALEGNFGTAFRHKSNALWVLTLVLVLAGTRRFDPRVDRTVVLERSSEAPTDSVAPMAQQGPPPASM